jgi:hypothetical protein
MLDLHQMVRAGPCHACFSMSRRIASFAALTLALVAVSVLVFQPICEAEELQLPMAGGTLHAAPPQGDEGTSCCSIAAPVAVKAASLAAEEPRCSNPQAAPALPAVPCPATFVRLASKNAAPPPVRTYHARSARIQR